jgi:hypothetical protein
MEDDISEIDCNSRQYMLSNEVVTYMDEKFCNTLKPFGIENYGERFSRCFNTYFISWGKLVQLYLYDGEFDGNVLDMMFKYIEKNFNSHPPAYYEIEYELWNQDAYNDYACKRYIDVIESYLEDAKETYHPKYVKEMERLHSLGLFSSKKLPGNSKYYIKVLNLDPETMKVNYAISTDSWGYHGRKQGLTTVDDVIAIATQPGLFDQMDFRVDPK